MKISATILSFIVYSLFMFNAQAQRGYAKDSLQIKVYTEITYKNYQVESLKVTRIFCDYCDASQKKALKQEAWNLTYSDRFSKKNKLQNGIRKLALYIRIAKKDFLKMKNLDH